MLELRNFDTEDLKAELERREMNIPEVVVFRHFLRTPYTYGEFVEWFEDQTDIAFSDDIMSVAFQKFYEVGLECEMDTRTGEVKILKVV